MRVFLGLAEIAGYYQGLKQGFQELGHETSLVTLSKHPFGYAGVDENVLADLWQWLHARPERSLNALKRVPRTLLFLWAAARFDLFIFSFGTSLLPSHRDLPLLKQLGKKVLFQFHGSDSRPPYMDGSVMAADRGRSVADGIRLTHERKRSLRQIERWADATVNIVPQAHLFEKPFVEWMQIGIPVRPAGAPTRDVIEAFWQARGAEGPIRVLHSPSHPAAKGSEEIAATIARLAARGIPLELVMMKDRPNREVLEELARTDLVVDQLYADYGMPGFAVEAAWFGKPVVIGGYAAGLWERLLPPEARPPTQYCHPSDVERAIEALATDALARRTLGLRARAFVETRWSPREVASRYLRIAAGDVPAEWLRDPRTIDYWQGAGLPEDRVRALIRAFVDEGGPGALEVADKPELERELLALAQSSAARL